MDAKSLQNEHPSFGLMARRYELPRGLLGNTIGMQDANTRWLPKERKETDRDYNDRLRRTALYNPFGQVVDQAASRPFRNPITLAEEDSLPEGMEFFLDDVDLEGRSVTQFARDVTKDAMAYGMGLFLVEWSMAQGRAFWKQLQPGCLFHWKQDPETMEIVEIRFRMEDVRADEETGELETVDVVWRYYIEEGAVLYERHVVSGNGKREEAVLEDSGALVNRLGDSLTEIPLVVVYANRESNLVAYPPYERLADLNWRHWQAYSDLTHLLRFVTIPILARFGVKKSGAGASDVDGKFDGPVTVSASSIIDMPQDGDLRYVEIQGKAVESALEDLDRIERKMEVEGATPMMRSGVQTATQTMVDEQAREAGMTAFVRALEVALTLGLEYVFAWNDEDMPEEMAVQVNEDRQLTAGREKRADMVLRARKDRVITNQTAILELKRDQILSDEVDADAESARVAREANDLVDNFGAFPDRDDEFGAGVLDEGEDVEPAGLQGRQEG